MKLSGLLLSFGDERATISSCFLRNRISRWSWVWDLNRERRNEKADLSMWAGVRVIVADSKVAKVVWIRYFGGG
jgi:hypothetical protein